MCLGLYALFAGLAAFAVSKELYIVGPDSVYVVGFIITYGLVLKYAGPYFRDVFEDLRLVGWIHMLKKTTFYTLDSRCFLLMTAECCTN